MTKPSGSATMRDELARMLFWQRATASDGSTIGWGMFALWECWANDRDECFAAADAILASDWLARVRAEEREAEERRCLAAIDRLAAQSAHVMRNEPALASAANAELLTLSCAAAAIRERNQ